MIAPHDGLMTAKEVIAAAEVEANKNQPTRTTGVGHSRLKRPATDFVTPLSRVAGDAAKRSPQRSCVEIMEPAGRCVPSHPAVMSDC